MIRPVSGPLVSSRSGIYDVLEGACWGVWWLVDGICKTPYDFLPRKIPDVVSGASRSHDANYQGPWLLRRNVHASARKAKTKADNSTNKQEKTDSSKKQVNLGRGYGGEGR